MNRTVKKESEPRVQETE